jgi:dihydropteroate synthase
VVESHYGGMMDQPLNSLACQNTLFQWGKRTYVMGIVNLSPDSFSGDGLNTEGAVIAQAERMESEGADIIDIGGESTRPDSRPIGVEEEIKRIVPAIEQLSRRLNLPISVDTYKYEVARAAIAAGAGILNDVWGLRQEARLAGLAAEHNLPIIVTSNQRGQTFEGDIMEQIISDLKRAAGLCEDAGVASENIIIDPGIGFGKTVAQNLEIIRRLHELKALGFPILLGTSRKSFIGRTLDLPENERLEGTAATVALGIAHGADIIRVHDVKEMARVARMTDAIVRG